MRHRTLAGFEREYGTERLAALIDVGVGSRSTVNRPFLFFPQMCVKQSG